MKSRGWGFLGFTLVVELLLFSLGTWQILRWREKTALVQTLTARSASPPLELSHLVDDFSLALHPILLKGTFLHVHEKVLVSRTFESKVGVHLVTPFRLEDGRTILVDRGWSRVPALPLVRRFPYPLRLQGVLQAVRPPGFFAPANEPAKNLWYVLDPVSLFAPVSFKKLYIISVKEGGGEANPRDPLPAFPNNHLPYALTWYVLMAGIFVAYRFLRQEERNTP